MSASGRRTSAGLLQFAAILLIFLVAGPPIGAITVFLLITLLGMGAKTDIGALVWMTLFAAIYAVPLSYFLGAIPALLAGAAIATARAVYGRGSIGFALLVGLCVGLGFILISRGRLIDLSGEWHVTMIAAVILVTCAVATVACHLIVRALAGGRTARSGAPHNP